MLVSIRDCRHSKKDRQWIQTIYGEYLDDLSDLNTSFLSVLGTDSPREHDIFAHWFSNELNHPLLILKGAEPVGFALVTRPLIPGGGGTGIQFNMAEFFVRDGHRRVGVGRNAARLIFDRFAGEWEIVEYQQNPGAIAFWRRVLGGYGRGQYTERSRNGEIRQRFSSGTSTR